MSIPIQKGRPVHAWGLFLVLPFLLGAGEPLQSQHDISPCAVAKEIAIKGVFLFDHQPRQGVAALDKAHRTCPTEFGIAFNLGLSHFLSDDKRQAEHVWEALRAGYPTHEKVLTNLAWVKFDLGKDDEANRLATQGLALYPESWALAHTKVFALFRLGRYLEAYDWLTRTELSGIRIDQWRVRAATYVVEMEWNKFRQSRHIEAIHQAVNLLVRWYPTEPVFIEAKDRLLLAHLAEDAVVPYPIDLPHESWSKTGNVDDQSVILDARLKALPPVAPWLKRNDAFAVVVGISRYEKLRARHFADRDARNVRQLLVGRGLFVDDVDHVRLRVNQEATRKTLQGDLQWLVRRGALNTNATLLFYFAGLGISQQTGQVPGTADALLLPVESRLNTLGPDTALSLAELKTALEKLPNKNIIVVLDTCFNERVGCAVYGTGGQQNTSESNGRRGRSPAVDNAFFRSRHAWVVAAVQKEAQLFAPGRQGSLTYFLLKGLLGEGDGADGSSQDGWVDLAEAITFAKSRLPAQEADLFLSQPLKVRLAKASGEK